MEDIWIGTMAGFYIVAVACSINDVILSMPKPARHSDIMKRIGHLIDDHSSITQGFLTNDGKFLNRQEAKHVAVRNRQTIASHHSTELFSEDLW